MMVAAIDAAGRLTQRQSVWLSDDSN